YTLTVLFYLQLMRYLLVVLLLFPQIVSAQNHEAELIIYNIGFGGLSGGVGAVINKKTNENWKKSFIRGFWQGSIGGAVNYTGKKTIYQVVKHKDMSYALPSRLLSSAGNSIIYNAALNEPFLQNWNIDYGIFRIDFSTKSAFGFNVRILPVAVISTGMAIPKGKIDWNTTLLSGVMTFSSNDYITTTNGSTHDGVNYGRAFVYKKNDYKYHIIAHELMHEYQYRDYLVTNTFLKMEAARLKSSPLKRFVTKYFYPDLPYYGLAYMIEGVERGPNYFKNYFELEAECFATNNYVH
ncbi:MAG TPA: hypothetical protein VGD33_07595, partial [Chitinophagaceae bacterium]